MTENRRAAANDEHPASHVVVEADGTWHRVQAPTEADRERVRAGAVEWMDTARARAEGDKQSMRAYSQLLAIQDAITELGNALARGEDVGARVDGIFRATTGTQAVTDDRRRVIIAIASVAQHSDEAWSRNFDEWRNEAIAIADDEAEQLQHHEFASRFVRRERGAPITDDDLAWLVCRQLELERSEVAARLRSHSATVALAVRLWRRKAGKPRKGEPRGSRTVVLAEILQLGGLGKIDAKTVEQLLRDHPVKIP